jgi:hypothetical protein
MIEDKNIPLEDKGVMEEQWKTIDVDEGWHGESLDDNECSEEETTNLQQDTRDMNFTSRHKVFLSILEKNYGMITATLKECKVHDQTWARWRKRVKGFSEAYEAILERVLDKAEIRLCQKVESGDMKAISYLLDNKGKRRGYGVKDMVVTSKTDVPMDYSKLTVDELSVLQDLMTKSKLE